MKFNGDFKIFSCKSEKDLKNELIFLISAKMGYIFPLNGNFLEILKISKSLFDWETQNKTFQ